MKSRINEGTSCFDATRDAITEFSFSSQSDYSRRRLGVIAVLERSLHRAQFISIHFDSPSKNFSATSYFAGPAPSELRTSVISVTGMITSSAGCALSRSATARGGSTRDNVRWGLKGRCSAGKSEGLTADAAASASETNSRAPSVTPSQIMRARLARGNAPSPSKRIEKLGP